jgi:hypothetical protein
MKIRPDEMPGIDRSTPRKKSSRIHAVERISFRAIAPSRIRRNGIPSDEVPVREDHHPAPER